MRERIEAIDFWRGVALVTIFINHIPGNILGNLTPRNFGFSDSAEAFVFLSGFSVVAAYRRRFELERPMAAARPLLARAAHLYKTHVILTLVAVLLFGGAAALTGQDILLIEHGGGAPLSDPIGGALGILALSCQIANFNILPLYVIFLIAAPALIVLGLQCRWRMLAASVGLYAVSRVSGYNLPSWPTAGVWYFNPLSWQLIFALGMFSGLSARRGDMHKSRSAWLAALAVTLIGALIVSNVFGLAPGLVDAAGQYLDWDKTQLGTVRILSFVALAYVIHHSGVTLRLSRFSLYPAASILGRHALPVYCIGSVLSAIGEIITDGVPHSPVFDVLYVALCLKLLHECAGLMERRIETRFAMA